MPTATFTSRWVGTVAPPKTGQVDYFDSKPPGVGLRVTVKGRKTWFVMYRIDGRLRRLTLGTYPTLSLADARHQALTVRHAVAQGEDPAAQKQTTRHALTLEELVADYLKRYAKVYKKSWRNDERLFDKEVLPSYGKRKAHDITRRDVIDILDRLVERGVPFQANRVLALVRKLYNWAISRDFLEYNPCVQIKQPGRTQQRDRVLTDDEIRQVWKEFEQLGVRLGSPYKLQLLTAQRGGEIGHMRWRDIDFESCWWTIPGSMTKNGLAHRVPLSPPAIEILSSLNSLNGDSEWVFPGRRPTTPRARETFHHYVIQIRTNAGVPFVGHDLRRTAASHMASMGISRLVVGKILNHVERGVTAVYDRHSYDAEKRDALERWARKVMSIVGEGESARVIPMHR